MDIETINEMNNLIYNSDKIMEKDKRIIIKKFEKIKNNVFEIYDKLGTKCKELLKESSATYIHLHKCRPELNIYCSRDKQLNEVASFSIYWYEDFETFQPVYKNNDFYIYKCNKYKFAIKWKIKITYKKNISLTISQVYGGGLIFGIYYTNKKYNLRFSSIKFHYPPMDKAIQADILQTISKLKILDKIERVTKNLNIFYEKYKKMIKKYFK